MLPAKFVSIWPSSFRGEDCFNISQSETRIALDAFWQVWFHLAQLFQRSRLKYEKVNGRTMDAK
jgi:hypothetical protein